MSPDQVGQSIFLLLLGSYSSTATDLPKSFSTDIVEYKWGDDLQVI